MNDDVINRQAATTIPILPKEHRKYQTMNIDDAYDLGWLDCQNCIEKLPPAQPELIEKTAYIRGFEQGRTQGMIDSQAEEVAQPNLQPTCNQLATDVISRQVAIDALTDYWHGIENRHKTLDGEMAVYCDCKNIIKRLPSAEPTQTNTSNMLDAISRQDAVSRFSDLLMVELRGERLPTWDEVYNAIKELPSVQPTQNNRVNSNNALDTISRQAAIDALKERRTLYCDNTPASFSELSFANKSRVDELDTAIATLINLPPAQPERDIPMKPNETIDTAWGIRKKQAVCPKCDYYLGRVEFIGNPNGKKVTYCETCGQAIDWEGWEWEE